MQRESSLIVIGIVFILASAAIYGISVSNMGVKTISIPANGEKSITYNLTSGNYTLTMHASRPIYYSFSNSTATIAQGNVSEQLVKKLGYLNGTYTLLIKNMNGNATVVALTLKSEKSMMSLSAQLTASGGICITGLVIGGIGGWLLIRRRRKDVS